MLINTSKLKLNFKKLLKHYPILKTEIVYSNKRNYKKKQSKDERKLEAVAQTIDGRLTVKSNFKNSTKSINFIEDYKS